MLKTFISIFLLNSGNISLRKKPIGCNLISEVTNPICGDELQLFINIKKNKIVNDAKFLTSGCASTIAIASYGTEHIIGKPMNEIKIINSPELQEGVGGLPANKNHASALFIEAIKNLQIAKIK